jgi:hypothetical protein
MSSSGGDARPSEALRATRALCEGEDSAVSRSALRRLAVEAGHDPARVAAMDRDGLCALLGVSPTSFRGASAFRPDFPLLGATRAMREISGFAAGGKALIVRDDLDARTHIETLEVFLPATVESGPPESVTRTSLLELPPLPEGFELTGEPALYFSQGADVAPGAVVLRVVRSSDDRLAAACVAGFGGLVPEMLSLYNPTEDTEYSRGLPAGEMYSQGLVCIFAGLVGAPGPSATTIEAVRQSTRVCLVHYIRSGEPRYVLAVTLPEGRQHVVHGLGDSPRASFAADPTDPSRARLVVSCHAPDNPQRLIVDSFVIRSGQVPEPEYRFSGQMRRGGHAADDVAFIARPVHRQDGPVLRVTSRGDGAPFQVRSVVDYAPPADPEDDLDTEAGRGEALADGSLMQSRVRLDHAVPLNLVVYSEIATQDTNPLAGDLLLLRTPGLQQQNLFLTGGKGIAAEIPAPRMPGFVLGAVAATSNKDPRFISPSRDTYVVALSAADSSSYRICVANRAPDGGVRLVGYVEFLATQLGRQSSRFFGIVAEIAPDLAEHTLAAQRTRYGLSVVGARGAAPEAAAGAAMGAAGPPQSKRSRDKADEDEDEEDEVLAAALRRRLR